MWDTYLGSSSSTHITALNGTTTPPVQQVNGTTATETYEADTHIIEPNDVADASALALCLYHRVRFAA